MSTFLCVSMVSYFSCIIYKNGSSDKLFAENAEIKVDVLSHDGIDD